jgi:hypothetical protein
VGKNVLPVQISSGAKAPKVHEPVEEFDFRRHLGGPNSSNTRSFRINSVQPDIGELRCESGAKGIHIMLILLLSDQEQSETAAKKSILVTTPPEIILY